MVFLTKMDGSQKKKKEKKCDTNKNVTKMGTIIKGGLLYVTAVEALRKRGRQDETPLTTKIDGFLGFALQMYFFASF